MSRIILGGMVVGSFLLLAAVVQADPKPVTQIPAGSTAQIRAEAVPAAAADPDAPKSKVMLKDALAPETRKTLQQAMESGGAGH